MNGRNISQITYSTLVAQQQCIRVPMLQRDYAQGRSDQREVREGFLAALEQALERPVDDPELPLNLDFIYGSLEGTADSTRFAPLDGQQRLTTLFLLHWFMAWQDGAWTEFGRMFRDSDGRSKFTYNVRQSSNEFFDKLVAFEPPARPRDTDCVVSLITDQPWYFRHWRLDPTVQSVLTMLGAIHRRFSGSSGLFARLTNTQQPAVTFQLLLLENFGLSDDLYIKMNARGKPLTAFENFKAQYEHSLDKQFSNQTRRIGEREYSVAKFVAHRMDTTWADFFWPHRVADLCDEVMMNLFRVIALVTRDPGSSAYLEDASLLRDTSNPASYSAFQSRGWLHEEFTEALIALLEAWSARSGATGRFQPLLPDGRYFDESAVFERIRHDSSRLTLTEVTQFTAYVLFIRHYPEAVATAAFQEWMRVVRNLSVNTPIEVAVQLRSAAQGLRELMPTAADVLNHLAKQPAGARVQGFYHPQVAEEQTKAGLLLHHQGWRALIDRAEQHGYFLGQIDFLCDFSGAIAKRKLAPDFSWGNEFHLEIQARFAFYLAKAEAMFYAGGLKDDDQHRWQRALLVVGDYLLPAGSNRSLLLDAATDPASWKRLLRTGPYEYAPENLNRPFLRVLWDRLGDSGSVVAMLDSIIAGASDLPAWRSALVRTPEAIGYCGRRAIRWTSEEDIMLLGKSTMGSLHAELFTYCLYHELKTVANRSRISPLKVWDYQASKDSDNLPQLLLRFQAKDGATAFYIHHDCDAFVIRVLATALESQLELKELLTKSKCLTPTDELGYWLGMTVARPDIFKALELLAKLLSTLPTK